MQNESINRMKRPPVDPLAAAFCFWKSLSGTSQYPATARSVHEIINATSSQSDEQQLDKVLGIPGTSKPPTTVSEIIESTPNQSDEQRPDDLEESSNTTISQLPICQDSQPGKRQNRPQNGLTTSGESEELESCIIRFKPGRRRWEKPPVRLGMDLVAHLVRPFFDVICFYSFQLIFRRRE